MTLQDEKECQILGRALLDKHGLHDWHISFENLRNVMYTSSNPGGYWGYCDFGVESLIDSKTEALIRSGVPVPGIELVGSGLAIIRGKTIRLDYRLHRRRFRQVMLHEIAHALCGKPEPGQGHNARWGNTALRIGCTLINVCEYCSIDELVKWRNFH